MAYEDLSPREKAAVDLAALQDLSYTEGDMPEDLSTATDQQLIAVYISDLLDGVESTVELSPAAIALVEERILANRIENADNAENLEGELRVFLRNTRRIDSGDIVNAADRLVALEVPRGYNGPDNTALSMDEYYALTPEQRHQAAEEGLARLTPAEREAVNHYDESSFFAAAMRGSEWHQQPGNREVYRENFINSVVLDQDRLATMVESYAQLQQQQEQDSGHGLTRFPQRIEQTERFQ